MRIPVFVSVPTVLNPDQDARYRLILRQLENLDLEPRTLGQSDYPTDLPLREVVVIAKHCAGGVVLGFSQTRITSGQIKPGTQREEPIEKPRDVPSPWNHLEAGIMAAIGLPLLVFREPGVSGGIFDTGVTDAFIHRMPGTEMTQPDQRGLNAVFLKWQARVRDYYYR